MDGPLLHVLDRTRELAPQVRVTVPGKHWRTRQIELEDLADHLVTDSLPLAELLPALRHSDGRVPDINSHLPIHQCNQSYVEAYTRLCGVGH